MIHGDINNMVTNSKAGIYKITYTKDNKVYVGSSINLKSRKYNHFKMLEQDKHTNRILQNYYNKYGKDNFVFEIIEYVEEEEDIQLFKNNILDRENYWIKELKAYEEGFNILPIAGSNLGFRHDEETKARIKEANLGKKMSLEHKALLKEFLTGRKLPEETKQKIRKAHEGKRFTEEHKRNISLSNEGHEVLEETKNKISKSLTGRKLSEETKQKMRASSKGRGKGKSKSNNFLGKTHTEETKNKISKSLTGRKLSEETKQKLREIQLAKKHLKEMNVVELELSEEV